MILASNSPRRKNILEEVGYSFKAGAHETDESYPESLLKHQVAKYLATKKNRYHREIHPAELIITADTTVLLEGELLEKPADLDEAKRMITKLSGKRHQVITGVCISNATKEISFDDTTEVIFKDLSQDEIDFYVENHRPLDKAGAYGIQEWIGMIGISQINGSYFNVVGLPIEKLYNVLKEAFDILPNK